MTVQVRHPSALREAAEKAPVTGGVRKGVHKLAACLLCAVLALGVAAPAFALDGTAAIGVAKALVTAAANPHTATPQGFRGLPAVASRGLVGTNSGNGTDPKTTFRSKMCVTNQTSDLRLVFANIIATTGGVETSNTSSITITAGVEYPEFYTVAVTFNGQASITIAPGAIAVSDPVGLNIPAGTCFWTRQAVAQGGSTVWPLNVQSLFASGNSGQDGDGIGLKINGATNASPIVISSVGGDHQFQTGDTAVISGVTGNTAANGTWTVTRINSSTFSLNGSTGNGAWTGGGLALGSDMTKAGSGYMLGAGGTQMFAPVMVLGGYPSGQNFPWACILGDSIAQGTGDNQPTNLGWITRGLGNWLTPTMPWVDYAVPGTRASQFGDLTLQATQSIVRRTLCLGAPYVFDEYGINDVNNGVTVAQLQAFTLSIATSVAARGGRVIDSTLLPNVTCATNCTTVSDQTPAANESKRTAINDWKRCGEPISGGVAVACGTAGALVVGQAGHPVWKVIDPDALVEVNSSGVLTLDGGRWRVDLGQPTTDGTHPTATLHATLSAAVPLSQMVAY